MANRCSSDEPALDHSGSVQKRARSMDPDDHVRRRADVEPRGFLPRGATAGPPAWRRVADWLFGDREDIDQQGLLAERTLLPRPRPERRRPAGERIAPS